jgi:chaperonin GroES
VLEPLNDGIIIRTEKEDGKTKGGLIMGKPADDRAAKGTVVSVGSGRLLSSGVRVPLGVKPNDIVLYNKHAGVPVQDGNENYAVILETDLLAVVRG